MAAELADRVAADGTQLYTEHCAARRTAAGLLPLPAAALAEVKDSLRASLRAVLVAPRRGQPEVSPAEAAEDLAWAAAAEGNEEEVRRQGCTCHQDLAAASFATSRARRPAACVSAHGPGTASIRGESWLTYPNLDPA